MHPRLGRIRLIELLGIVLIILIVAAGAGVVWLVVQLANTDNPDLESGGGSLAGTLSTTLPILAPPTAAETASILVSATVPVAPFATPLAAQTSRDGTVGFDVRVVDETRGVRLPADGKTFYPVEVLTLNPALSGKTISFLAAGGGQVLPTETQLLAVGEPLLVKYQAGWAEGDIEIQGFVNLGGVQVIDTAALTLFTESLQMVVSYDPDQVSTLTQIPMVVHLFDPAQPGLPTRGQYTVQVRINERDGILQDAAGILMTQIEFDFHGKNALPFTVLPIQGGAGISLYTSILGRPDIDTVETYFDLTTAAHSIQFTTPGLAPPQVGGVTQSNAMSRLVIHSDGPAQVLAFAAAWYDIQTDEWKPAQLPRWEVSYSTLLAAAPQDPFWAVQGRLVGSGQPLTSTDGMIALDWVNSLVVNPLPQNGLVRVNLFGNQPTLHQEALWVQHVGLWDSSAYSGSVPVIRLKARGEGEAAGLIHLQPGWQPEVFLLEPLRTDDWTAALVAVWVPVEYVDVQGNTLHTLGDDPVIPLVFDLAQPDSITPLRVNLAASPISSVWPVQTYTGQPYSAEVQRSSGTQTLIQVYVLAQVGAALPALP